VAAAAGRKAHGAKEMSAMAKHGKEHPGKPFHDAEVGRRGADVGGPVGSSHNHGMGKPHDGSKLYAEMGKTVPSFDHERNERLESGNEKKTYATVDDGFSEDGGKPGHGRDD
jgi:hypothetical protein